MHEPKPQTHTQIKRQKLERSSSRKLILFQFCHGEMPSRPAKSESTGIVKMPDPKQWRWARNERAKETSDATNLHPLLTTTAPIPTRTREYQTYMINPFQIHKSFCQHWIDVSSSRGATYKRALKIHTRRGRETVAKESSEDATRMSGRPPKWQNILAEVAMCVCDCCWRIQNVAWMRAAKRPSDKPSANTETESNKWKRNMCRGTTTTPTCVWMHLKITNTSSGAASFVRFPLSLCSLQLSPFFRFFRSVCPIVFLTLCMCASLLLWMRDTLHFMLSFSIQNSLHVTDDISSFVRAPARSSLFLGPFYAILNISISSIYSTCLLSLSLSYVPCLVSLFFIVHAWAAIHFSSVLHTHVTFNSRQRSTQKN